MAVDLDRIVAAPDDLFSLDTAEPGTSMSRLEVAPHPIREAQW